jgi:hypothetical protein
MFPEPSREWRQRGEARRRDAREEEQRLGRHRVVGRVPGMLGFGVWGLGFRV